MTEPTFSICIPTYQQHTLLHQLLKSIDENTVMNHEIIIEDNSFSPIGYPKAINNCIKRANGEYVILLNDDILVESLWLEQMYTELKKEEKIGVVGPGPPRNDGWGNPHISFYCVMIPMKIITEVGLLDERFGIGTWEDVDYCKRLKDAGYTIKGMDIPVKHEGTKTFNKIKPVNDLIAEGRKLYKEKWGFK